MTRRCRGERGGSGALEAVILVPAVLAMFALVVAYGRTTLADGKVEHAAAVGARAAASAQTAGGGSSLAQRVVDESLAGAGLACSSRSVSVGGDYAPGGRVTVSVSCVASLADLTGLGLPLGSRTLTATASEVIDVNRGGAP
ncbi:MAG: TadE/TadG family type IV pilus assembly protein [Ilumatobacteraceae bacterium]